MTQPTQVDNVRLGQGPPRAVLQAQPAAPEPQPPEEVYLQFLASLTPQQFEAVVWGRKRTGRATRMKNFGAMLIHGLTPRNKPPRVMYRSGFEIQTTAEGQLNILPFFHAVHLDSSINRDAVPESHKALRFGLDQTVKTDLGEEEAGETEDGHGKKHVSAHFVSYVDARIILSAVDAYIRLKDAAWGRYLEHELNTVVAALATKHRLQRLPEVPYAVQRSAWLHRIETDRIFLIKEGLMQTPTAQLNQKSPVTAKTPVVKAVKTTAQLTEDMAALQSCVDKMLAGQEIILQRLGVKNEN